MKVKDLIKRLNENYKPDDTLIVGYYDKKIYVNLTDRQWNNLVRDNPLKNFCNHKACWRDCERHPDLECFVLDCPHNPAPDYDCEEEE